MHVQQLRTLPVDKAGPQERCDLVMAGVHCMAGGEGGQSLHSVIRTMIRLKETRGGTARQLGPEKIGKKSENH